MRSGLHIVEESPFAHCTADVEGGLGAAGCIPERRGGVAGLLITVVLNPWYAAAVGGGVIALLVAALHVTGKLHFVVEDLVVRASELVLLAGVSLPVVSILVSASLDEARKVSEQVVGESRGFLLDSLGGMEERLRADVKETPKEVLHHLAQLEERLFGRLAHVEGTVSGKLAHVEGMVSGPGNQLLGEAKKAKGSLCFRGA
mmetsp:Transcript_67105/g.189008  ORF Transcript_67105/g.189008 Transcript_67105/m.189008 type:complete len:202 (+) Transcript_67105:76-681(+)